jgi:uncharacterized membrane protein
MPSLAGAILGLIVGLLIGYLGDLGAFTIATAILGSLLGIHWGLYIEERDYRD